MKKSTQISSDNSLYAHSQQLIDDFNHLIAMHEQSLYDFVPNTKINSYVDFFSSIFNYWVQLIDTDELRVAKIEKLIFHTFTFELNKYLAENVTTKKFLEKERRSEEIFVYTYFFTYNFLYYMHSHMPEELLQRFIRDKDYITLYATNDSDLQNELLQDIYAYRKDFLADIRGNMQVRFDIQRILNEAVVKTELYFDQH